MVQDTGDGGNCGGLTDLTGPQPCNTAPLMQYYDPLDRIQSVELVMLDDMSGVYLDNLEVATIPEPTSLSLFVAGLAGFVWIAKRRSFRSQKGAAAQQS